MNASCYDPPNEPLKEVPESSWVLEHRLETEFQRLNILNTLPATALIKQQHHQEVETAQYNLFAEMTAGLLSAPVGRVSLVDLSGRFCVIGSHHSQEKQHHHQYREQLLSLEQQSVLDAHTVMNKNSNNGLLIVSDTLADARFHALPEVTGAPQVRFYAGVALVSRTHGRCLGTICVTDTEPRSQGLWEEEVMILQEIASEIELYMEQNMTCEYHEPTSKDQPHSNTPQPRLKYTSSMPDMRSWEQKSVAEAPNKQSGTASITEIRDFLSGLELIVDICCPKKNVNVFLRIEQPMPDRIEMPALEAFRSASAILTSALERTESGYIQLCLSLRKQEDGGHEYLLFECEDTAPPICCHSSSTNTNPFAPSPSTPMCLEESGCFEYDKAAKRIVPKPTLSSSSSSSNRSPNLEAVARYMDSVGGSYGVRQREQQEVSSCDRQQGSSTAATATTTSSGSVVWFSLPVRASSYWGYTSLLVAFPYCY